MRSTPAGPGCDIGLQLDLMPEPFLGRLDAPVVLLNLNPGYVEKDRAEHADKRYSGAIRAMLGGEPAAHPLALLDPRFGGFGGHDWWEKKARRLVRASTLDAVTNGVLVVEWFPYHSAKYRSLRGGPLPSFEFSKSLVEAAMERGAVIVAMRSRRRWEDAVPALNTYSKYSWLASPQNVALSPNNLGPQRFDEIVQVLST